MTIMIDLSIKFITESVNMLIGALILILNESNTSFFAEMNNINLSRGKLQKQSNRIIP